MPIHILPHDKILVERFFPSAQLISLMKASKVCINLRRVGGCSSLWQREPVKGTVSQRARCWFPARVSSRERMAPGTHREYSGSARGSCAPHQALKLSLECAQGRLARLRGRVLTAHSSGLAGPSELLDVRRDRTPTWARL